MKALKILKITGFSIIGFLAATIALDYAYFTYCTKKGKQEDYHKKSCMFGERVSYGINKAGKFFVKREIDETISDNEE